MFFSFYCLTNYNLTLLLSRSHDIDDVGDVGHVYGAVAIDIGIDCLPFESVGQPEAVNVRSGVADSVGRAADGERSVIDGDLRTVGEGVGLDGAVVQADDEPISVVDNFTIGILQSEAAQVADGIVNLGLAGGNGEDGATDGELWMVTGGVSRAGSVSIIDHQAVALIVIGMGRQSHDQGEGQNRKHF